MFGFRKKPPQPLATARSAAKWLASLPGNDPLGVQRIVLAELRQLEERTTRRTPSKLAAVFAVDTHMNGVVNAITAQYAEHAGRSPKVENQLWQALFDLTQGFQTCYAAFARDIPERRLTENRSALLAELLARQIMHLHRDAKYRLYRSEPWIPVKWAKLHAPLMRACAHQIERRPLLLDLLVGHTTIEREYLVALVLQLADPGNLTAAQVEWVASQLNEWCRPLQLTVKQSSSSTFYVDLAGSAGLRRRSTGPLEGRVLFVDTGPLHALLLLNRAVLEQALGHNPLPEIATRQREQLDLFVRLANRVDPDFKPHARRGERAPTSGAVDAIVGLHSISGFLHDDEITPTTEFSAGRSYGNTLELAVFGRTRKEPDQQIDHARHRIATYATPGGPWEMKDVSSSGFRLHAPMSVATEVTLSMLVAFQRRGQDAWELGIVRRMRRLSANNAEIGLQSIANALIGADLVVQGQATDVERTVNGVQAVPVGREFHGLFLMYSRRPGDQAVQSLIVPPADYRPDGVFALQAADAAQTIRFTRVVERHTDWVWTVIEPVEAVEPDDTATAATPR